MRLRRIVGCGGDPRGHISGRFEGPSNNRPGDVELERALNEARVGQPDDVFLIVIEFRTVVIVEAGWVRLQMSVHERRWVIGVRLVQVLLRHRRGEDKPGR
jgi:hypothetical protein